MVTSLNLNKSEIYQWLTAIVDPEIPVVTIEEMGMLKDVVIDGDLVKVIITPTYTGCPAMGIIQDDIEALLKSKGIDKVEVKLVYSPAWTTDNMTIGTKEKLREYGIAAPLHSSCRTAFNMTGAEIACPRCASKNTKMISFFGSTACKSLYSCNDCKEPFDYFKCH